MKSLYAVFTRTSEDDISPTQTKYIYVVDDPASAIKKFVSDNPNLSVTEIIRVVRFHNSICNLRIDNNNDIVESLYTYTIVDMDESNNNGFVLIIDDVPCTLITVVSPNVCFGDIMWIGNHCIATLNVTIVVGEPSQQYTI